MNIKKLIVEAISFSFLFLSIFTPIVTSEYAEFTATDNMYDEYGNYHETEQGTTITNQGSWYATKHADASAFSYDNSHKSQTGELVDFFKACAYWNTTSLPHYMGWSPRADWGPAPGDGRAWYFDWENYTITKVEVCVYMDSFTDYFYILGNHSWCPLTPGYALGAPTFPMVKACAGCKYDCGLNATCCPPEQLRCQCVFSDKIAAVAGWNNVSLNEWGILDIGYQWDPLSDGYPIYGMTGYAIFNTNYMDFEANTTTQMIQFQGPEDAHPPILKVWYEENGLDDPQFISINENANGTTILDSTPTFKWTIADGASQYHLQVASDSAFTELVVNISNINDVVYPSNCNINSTRVSFTLPDAYALSDYKTYYCRVRAFTSE